MSANNTLGVDEDVSDVKEDSLPTTATLLDKTKSLFGNSSDAHSAPVMDSANGATEEDIQPASNTSDPVESGADATNTKDTAPSNVQTEKEEPMDTSDSPNPATADTTAEESFEKKTISMDTSAATADVPEIEPVEAPEEKMEEDSETAVKNGTEENGDADKTDNIPEDNEEPEAELVMGNDDEKTSADGRGTSDPDEELDAADDENVKTDEDFEEDDEDEEEEEAPRKKPKRTVVDDDDMSDEQTADGSGDQVEPVDGDEAASEGAPEVVSHVSPDSSTEKDPSAEVENPEKDEVSEAAVLDDSSAFNKREDKSPEDEEVIADESTKEEQTGDVTEDTSDAQAEAVDNEHEEPTDNIVAAAEPTSSRSTRAKRTSTAAPPLASATPRRGGRGRQSQAKAENDDASQERSTPARRGRSSRGARAEEEQTEAVNTGDDQVEVEDDDAGEEKEEEQAETPKRSGRGRRSVASTRVVATPRSTRGKGRKSQGTKESAEPAAEVQEEGASNAEPKRTPRQRRSTVNAEEEVHEEDPTEASGPSTSTSRRSGRARAPAKSAPATPATNKRTPARGRKKEISITEETAEEVEKSEDTPVAKKGGRRKSAPVSSKKTDEPDPYDIDTEMEHHPEPLKNIHVQMEVQSFGTVKYAKTGSSESKYSKTEKAAESRVSELQTTPEGKNKRSLADMTPGKEKQKRQSSGTGGRKPRVKKDSVQAEDVVMEEVPQPEASETPSSSNRGRKRKSEMSDIRTPPVKRDQAVAMKMLNDEEQLLADHPEDDNCPHAPGARVYAIFQKTFYPAVILAERDGLGRYKLQFVADKVIKDVPNSGVIPLRVLTPGKIALYNEEEVRLDSTPNDISAGEWAKGKLGITILDADGEPTEETKVVTWNEVSFDQSEWRDYVKGLEQSATAIVKANITTISEASRVRKPMITQAMKPKSRKKKSDDDAAPSRGASASPVDEDELIPMKPEAVGKNIFAGKVFMLTSASRSSASNVPPMLKKKNLMTFISQNGGEVTEHLNNFEERYPECQPLLISDTYYRTHKYLAALARAIPCVSNTWLKACGEMGECVDYTDYVLPAGASIFGDCADMPAPKNPSKLLTGRKIYVHSTHSAREVTQLGPGGTFVEIWKPILELLGAEVVDADWETLKDSGVTFDIVLTDGTFREQVLDYAKSIGASRVTSEWVIQTIILGEAPDPEGHTKFDPFRLCHRSRH